MERCKLRIAEIAILARSLAQQILMDLGLEPVWDQEHVYVPSSLVSRPWFCNKDYNRRVYYNDAFILRC